MITGENKERKLQLKSKKIEIVLSVALFLFICLILYVNISCNPDFYHSDMYCDLNYAKEAWKAKSFFPKSWIFGNQTYVFATPVITAALYGITSNVILSMAIASCIMTLLIIVTYDWMMKPLFRYGERTAAFLVMTAIILVRGNIATDQQGAQLFFTMASYYAGYLITVFVVLGCYIRIRKESIGREHIFALAISTVLSFCMGIQSVRQTAIMTIPLVACEVIFTAVESIKRKRLKLSKSAIYSSIIFIANILGIVAMKFIKINQTVFWGGMKIGIDGSLPYKIRRNISYIIGLFKIAELPQLAGTVFALIVLSGILCGVVCCVVRTVKKKETDTTYISQFAFFTFSCITLFGIGIFTDTNMRGIYYFMLFPFIALSAAYLLRCIPKFKNALCFLISICFILLTAFEFAFAVKKNEIGINKDAVSYQAAEYITEHNFECIYAPFDYGSNIAIASNDRVDLIFFGNDNNKPLFEPLDYLCVKDAHKDIDNSRCVYYIPKELREKSDEKANALGVKYTVLAEFEDGSCLCKMSENICLIAKRIAG